MSKQLVFETIKELQQLLHPQQEKEMSGAGRRRARGGLSIGGARIPYYGGGVQYGNSGYSMPGGAVYRHVASTKDGRDLYEKVERAVHNTKRQNAGYAASKDSPYIKFMDDLRNDPNVGWDLSKVHPKGAYKRYMEYAGALYRLENPKSVNDKSVPSDTVLAILAESKEYTVPAEYIIHKLAEYSAPSEKPIRKSKR